MDRLGGCDSGREEKQREGGVEGDIRPGWGDRHPAGSQKRRVCPGVGGRDRLPLGPLTKSFQPGVTTPWMAGQGDQDWLKASPTCAPICAHGETHPVNVTCVLCAGSGAAEASNCQV